MADFFDSGKMMTASKHENVWNPGPMPAIPVRNTSLLYPVARIFCVGRNYRAHAVEMGMPVDKSTSEPFYFTKTPADLVLSGATVAYPAGTKNFQYEMELVVAIGAECFRASESDAGRAIYGYACGLDMTRRDLQLVARDTGRPWDLSKDVEESAVVSELVPFAGVGLLKTGKISLSVNGQVKQQSDIGQLIWSVPELIAHLSRFYRLRPGDLMYTGTPEGVGPVVPGDQITGQIDAVGTIELKIGSPN
ncbi:MAG: fumarylacetoacetate hydrolase family protein [Dongiaceae bacterium]